MFVYRALSGKTKVKCAANYNTYQVLRYCMSVLGNAKVPVAVAIASTSASIVYLNTKKWWCVDFQNDKTEDAPPPPARAWPANQENTPRACVSWLSRLRLLRRATPETPGKRRKKNNRKTSSSMKGHYDVTHVTWHVSNMSIYPEVFNSAQLLY